MEKKRILVVDDEPNVLVTYRLILQQQGFEAHAAISSEEARRALDSLEFDLLLCDLSLEKQESGFDVIGYARGKHATLPAILLTGYASAEANEWAEAQKIPILFKPIDVQQLLDTISSLTRNDEHAIRQTTCE